MPGYMYPMMDGGYGGGMMAFGWLLYILVFVVLVLGIAALWKHLTKK